LKPSQSILKRGILHRQRVKSSIINTFNKYKKMRGIKMKNQGKFNLLFALTALTVIALFMIAGCTTTTEPTKPTDVPQTKPIVSPVSTTGSTSSNYVPGTYSETITDISKAVKTKNFASADELNAFIKKNLNSGSYGYYGSGRNALISEKMMTDSAVSPSAAPMALDSSGQNQFSETNNQVAGVDEADMIKTDGNYIYTITGDTLFIVKAYPGEDAKIVSTIKMEGNYPQSLFVKGNYLAVFGEFSNLDYFKKIDFIPRGGMTFFNIYDISDKESPELKKEYKFEGRYFNARMKDSYVYFVVASSPFYRPDMPTPIMFDGSVQKLMPVTDVYYYDIQYRNPELVTIHSINLANPTEKVISKSVAVEGSENIYMSDSNIFITSTEWINEYDLRNDIYKEMLKNKLTKTDKEMIEKIKATDDAVLSQYEKDSKILQVYYTYMNYMSSNERSDFEVEADNLLAKKLEEFKHLEYTVINKISVNNGKIEITDNGKVPGRIINQFSLDENNNVLRIATTISARWFYNAKGGSQNTQSTNNIYALDSKMKIIGELEGLAEGEQIYSTRFIGSRLYMVTFRQVDPFFVIDLSDPTDIKELGKLKIPGFSRYLHPYDDNTIIGIGQEASDLGRTTGLKISLFDVTNVEKPKEIAKFVTDEKYAQSNVLYEHKAFLFSKDKELLVIPAYSYEYDYRTGIQSKGYNGAFVFKITKSEIKLRGLIDHSKDNTDGMYYYQPMVERSLWINDLLYTKSPNLLRINEIGDLSSVKNISLTSKGTANMVIY
jgi:inhibitor of cysteine peptidase